MKIPANMECNLGAYSRCSVYYVPCVVLNVAEPGEKRAEQNTTRGVTHSVPCGSLSSTDKTARPGVFFRVHDLPLSRHGGTNRSKSKITGTLHHHDDHVDHDHDNDNDNNARARARVLQSASLSFVVFSGNAGVPRGVEGCAAHTNVFTHEDSLLSRE